MLTNYDDMQERIRCRSRTWVITGAAGFIGSHLVETLLILGQTVIGIDNFLAGSRANLAQVYKTIGEPLWKNFRFIQGDIRSINQCRQICRSASIVLHHAAVGGRYSIKDPVGANENNATGFLNMLVAAHGAGVTRFIYAVSGDTDSGISALPNEQSGTGKQQSLYAVTKYVNELYAETFARCYGFDSIGVRYFNVFGPRQNPDSAYASVVPDWISSMMRNAPVHVGGDAGTIRDFCYIDNVVRANLLAATVEDVAAVNRIYDIGMGEGIAQSTIFAMLRDMFEREYPHGRVPHPARREIRCSGAQGSVADIGMARRLLGYWPMYDVRKGLGLTLAWWAAQLSAQGAGGGQKPGSPAGPQHA